MYLEVIQGLGLALRLPHLTATDQNNEESPIFVIKLPNVDKNSIQILVESTSIECCWLVNWCVLLILVRNKNQIHIGTINVQNSNRLQVVITIELFSFIFVMKKTHPYQIVCFVSFKVLHQIIFSLMNLSMLYTMVFLALVL